MQNQLDNRIHQSLLSAIAWAEAKEQLLLSELIQLQRKINNLLETKPMKKKIIEEVKNQEVKEVEDTSKYHKKIQQLISQAESELSILDNPKKAKQAREAAQKAKKQQTLPQIQKKPPIPTVNRTRQPHNMFPKPVHRNKNEVTGKITQMPSVQGTKPKKYEKSTTKASSFSAQSASKTNSSSSKKIEHKPPKQSHSLSKQPQKDKVTYVAFNSFKKTIDELVEQVSQRRGKLSTHKPEMDKLISQYDRQILGYKQKEQKALQNFIKTFNSLTVTTQTLPLKKTTKIEHRGWDGHPMTFKFRNLLEYLNKLIQENPVSEEYETDPAEAYRIRVLHSLINQIFQQQIQPVRHSLKPPPKIGINFNMNYSEEVEIGSNDSSHGQNPYLNQFYALLSEQLSEIKEMEALDKPTLSKLRILISIGLFQGRRSPVITMSDKYEDWSDHYKQQN